MNVTFLGTGEACDSYRTNTSILLKEGETTVLLDCGFSVPRKFFALSLDKDDLDIVWISHLHGDHFFGLPQLLLHLHEQNRTKPFFLVGGIPLEDVCIKIMELAYPGLYDKLCFELYYKKLQPGLSYQLNNLTWQVAENNHSVPSFGLSLEGNRKRIYYSGDGKSNRPGEQLMKDADLVIHEAFSLTDTFENHGSVSTCLEIARKTKCKKMALVHLARESHEEILELKDLLKQSAKDIFLAEDDLSLEL